MDEPAKIYKMTLYVVDVNMRYSDVDELLYELDRGCETTLHPFGIEIAPIRWHDNIDINMQGSTQEDYEKYFKVNEMTHEEIEQALGYKVKIKQGE